MDPSTVNRRNCCVYGCHSRADKNPGLSFHSFPKAGESTVKIINKFGKSEEVDKRKAWILKIKTGKPVSTHMKICSLHFTKDDYILPDIPCKRRKLKRCAVPSCELPKEMPTNYSERQRRYENRKKNYVSVDPSFIFEHLPSTSQPTEDLPVTSAETSHTPSEEELQAVHALLELTRRPKTTDVGVQVKSGDLFLSFISFIDTEEKLNTWTGIPTFTVLESLEEAYKRYFPDKKTHKINIRERIILTFIKLKQNFSFVVFATLFRSLTSVTCAKVFNDTVDKLHFLLNVCITWPTKEEIINNMPIHFQEFEDVRIVLDCTEIPLQKPKCLCCRVKSYSHYKGQNTIKFLVGVSPGGLITFVSKAYGGRSSDKVILEQSNLFEKLTSQEDAVMIDKGFRINELAASYGIKVICPPFLRQKSQFTPEEANLNRKIARARVHIERVFQRVKMFKIVKDQIAWNIIPKIEKIFIILCAITNLRSPVLDDDKFLK